jgi:trimeric autotransporter adhesin
MAYRRSVSNSIRSIPIWLRIVLYLSVTLFSAHVAWASEYHGQVTFGGLPVPGVTVTATEGTKKFSTASDQGGVYSFADLPDGQWTITIEMQCFTTIHADVTVSANTPPGQFELQLLPMDQLMARTKLMQAPPTVLPTLVAPDAAKKAEVNAGGAKEIPKAPDEQSQSSDGFLVNGSVNNAATSQYSLDRAFGNRRPNSRSLYNGGALVQFGNSALDARTYSLSGQESPKPFYNLITGAVTVGGPMKIPRLLPRGPEFFAAYQWTRDQNELNETGLVPTDRERTGDFLGLVNAAGQPVTLINPATGLAFLNNQVPVSAQAQALLKLYPVANIANNPLYNYQVPALSDSHQDVVQTRLDKTLGHRDQLFGRLNFQSTRAGSVNLFGFVDTTDTLGLDASINWAHRFSQHLFFRTSYQFSRQRTEIIPEFESRENVSASAGISGNDQDPADWGPPALSFSSGIAGLSDENSAFNRNRTDRFSGSLGIYRGKHNITVGGDFRKQEYNDFYQQNPRGAFAFTGAATQGTAAGSATTGSDLADFLIGIPDTSSLAYGNADKYFRQPVYDVYAADDWRLLSELTINAGMRWEYGAPMTERYGRLVNLDLTPDFAAAAPVLGSDPVGPLTGIHYPSSLVRPDRLGFEPRVAISWRPIPASTVVVRAGYGVYHDTSVYLSSTQQLAQQAPLSTSLNVENSAACPLTLANGFMPCSTTSADTYAVDPNFRVGYAQTWQLAVQRDLPAALQMTVTYLGVKGTRGVQEFLPNTYPIGAVSPCPSCPIGFEYRTSGGDSTRESGQLQLRRRLRAGFTATLLYTYSKSVDDDALLGGQGHMSATSASQGEGASAGAGAGEGEGAGESTSAATPTTSIAQNWLDLKAERGLSTFDQRHLLSVQAQYTTGQGLEGGTLLGGWRGRLLKEWTVLTNIKTGTGMPESPSYFAAVPGTGFSSTIRPSLTGAPIYGSSLNAASGLHVHLNSAAYTAPAAGQWGTSARDSIEGPDQFSLDTSLERTFRPSTKFNLTARIDATNLLNHAVFTGWITTINSTQFGVPASVNAMRSLQATLRLRF